MKSAAKGWHLLIMKNNIKHSGCLSNIFNICLWSYPWFASCHCGWENPEVVQLFKQLIFLNKDRMMQWSCKMAKSPLGFMVIYHLLRALCRAWRLGDGAGGKREGKLVSTACLPITRAQSEYYIESEVSILDLHSAVLCAMGCCFLFLFTKTAWQEVINLLRGKGRDKKSI